MDTLLFRQLDGSYGEYRTAARYCMEYQRKLQMRGVSKRWMNAKNTYIVYWHKADLCRNAERSYTADSLERIVSYLRADMGFVNDAINKALDRMGEEVKVKKHQEDYVLFIAKLQ